MTQEANTTTSDSPNNFRDLLSRWLPVLVWMGVIFLFSNQPNSSHATEHVFGVLNLAARKIAHVSEFAILFFLVNRALRDKRLLALIVSIAYAASDEWHQTFVPGRSPSVSDVGIDTIGMLVAWCVLWWRSRKDRSKPA